MYTVEATRTSANRRLAAGRLRLLGNHDRQRRQRPPGDPTSPAERPRGAHKASPVDAPGKRSGIGDASFEAFRERGGPRGPVSGLHPGAREEGT